MDSYEGDQTSPGSLHKYLYGEGNPVDHLDPSGHEIDEILEVAAIAVALVSMSSCTRGPTQQAVTVEPIEYAQSSYGNGIHIEIGARLLLRMPHFAEYRWVQKVTTNATDPKNWNIMPPNSEYVDPQPHPEAGDFFYTKAEEPGQQHQHGYDYVFEDTPHRKPPSDYPYLQGRPVSWKANLYLVGVNPPGSTSYTKIIQITYGFRVFESGAVDADPMHATRLLPSQQQLF
jgi:hypothetical protein